MSSFQQIPNMNPVLALNGTEMFELVQNGATFRGTTQQIVDLVSSGAAPLRIGVTPIFGAGVNEVLYNGVGNKLAATNTLANAVLVTNGSGVPSFSTSLPAGIATNLVVGTSLIGSGTPNGLLYDNAGILGNLATANNGVLITSGGGVPSISSTLPSLLTIPSPTLNGTIAGTANGGTGGVSDALVTTAGFKPTVTIGTLPSGGTLTSPFDYVINVAQLNSDDLSDFRTERVITTFNNTTADNATKIYARYQGLNLFGTGPGNVFVTYGNHLFTQVGGATNVDNLIGHFHHNPILGTGVVGTSTGFQVGPPYSADLSITASATTNVLTVTVADPNNNIGLGYIISGTDGVTRVPAGTYVASFGTGVGGVGTYNLNQSVGSTPIGSTSMTARVPGTINSVLGFQSADIGGNNVHSVSVYKAADTTVDITGQRRLIGNNVLNSYNNGSGALLVYLANATISSATYDSPSGVITAVVGEAPGYGIGETVTLSNLTGTGGFATLAGSWVVTNIFATTITLAGPTGAGASTLTGGVATPTDTQYPAVIGNYYTLDTLTGTGAFASLNGSWIVTDVTRASVTLAATAALGASTITGGGGTPVIRVMSGTYDTGTGKITVIGATPITIGGAQSVTLSNLTGTGAFASLNGTWTTVLQDGTNHGHPNGTTLVMQGPLVAASTITGGVLTFAAGNIVGLRSEVNGPNNFSFLSSGTAPMLQTGPSIFVGNVTWQGLQTSLTQNYTISRAMGAVAGVNIGLTNQVTFSASNTNADVRGSAISLISSGGTAINNISAGTIAIAGSATALTTQMTGTLTSITINNTGSVTTARGNRTTVQLSGAGNGSITTFTDYLADTPTLGVAGSTGAISAREGFTANAIGHATLVTTAKGFRMLDTSAVTSVEAFAGEVTSGSGKWNVSITGSANNRFAGSTTFGATSTPGFTADVQGTLNVTGAATFASASFTSGVITSSSANAFDVGPAGTTNPVLQIDASTASQAAGLKITGAVTGGTVNIAAIDSGATTGLTISAKAGGTLTLGSGTNVVTVGRPLGISGATTITSSASQALAVGLNGATNPAFQVNAATASQAAGLNVTGAVTGGTVAINAIDSGAATNLTIDAKGIGTLVLQGTATGAITLTRATTISSTLGVSGATTITSSAANAFDVGANGSTNPVLQIDASTASQAAGVVITGAATGGTVQITAIDSGATTSLTIAAKAGGTLTLGATSNVVTLGRPTGVSGALTVTSAGSQSLAVGPNGATTPILQVNSATGSAVAGLNIIGAVTGGTVALAAIDSGSNTSLTLNAKGTGTLGFGTSGTGQINLARGVKTVLIIGSSISSLGTTQNSTPTAAQLLTGFVTQTSATGAGTVTLPTGTNMSSAVTGVATGDSFMFTFANLGGTFTLTITSASGFTVVGNGAVPTGKNAIVTCTCTGSNTWNAYVTVSA